MNQVEIKIVSNVVNRLLKEEHATRTEWWNAENPRNDDATYEAMVKAEAAVKGALEVAKELGILLSLDIDITR